MKKSEALMVLALAILRKQDAPMTLAELRAAIPLTGYDAQALRRAMFTLAYEKQITMRQQRTDGPWECEALQAVPS